MWVDSEYENRCGAAWSCLTPADEEDDSGPAALNWGLYFMVFRPYSDGPAFVEHLRAEGGWAAVNAAYDDVPQHSAEITHPDEYGEIDAEVAVEDRSTDRWRELDNPDGANYSEFGEAVMPSMLAYPTWESGGEYEIVSSDTFLNTNESGEVDSDDPIDYDQPYTDGWAGDRLVKYVTDDETIEESGYVWQTEWESEADAEEFVDGFLQLLEYRDAERVDDRQNTFVIDDGYPGAYYVEHDGETVTIVRAPTIEELSEIHDGAAPRGEDTLESEANLNGEGGARDNRDDIEATDGEEPIDGEESIDGEPEGDEGDERPGFGALVVVVALAILIRISTTFYR